jgi:LacI family transcriptional regulator
VAGRSHLVGLIVPDLVHPFFAEVAEGLSCELRKRGHSLVISSSEEDPDLEREEIDHLLARGVDALVLAPTQWTVESFREIEEQKVPYLLIDRRFAGFPAHFVGVDDELSGMMAVEHLIQQGCKRIAHILGQQTSTAIGRMEGYRQALRKHDLAAPKNYVVAGEAADDSGDVSGYLAMQQLLSVRPRPDAVFCYNDPIAMGAMKAILGAKLRIPEDVAIVGCGNVTYAELLRVPLTSIDLQSNALGRQTAKQLWIDRVKDAIAPRGNPARTETHCTRIERCVLVS